MTAAGAPRSSGTSVGTGPGEPALINPLEFPGWDERVADFPGATIFHTTAWARVLAGTYGFKPFYFVRSKTAKVTVAPDSNLRRGTSDQSELAANAQPWMTAVLPLMEINSWLTGRRAVGLPFTDSCPPLVAAEEPVSELFESAAAHGRSRGWKTLEVRGGCEPSSSASISCAFYGHHIDLDRDEEASFQRLDPGTRRALRKAGQSGVTLTECATRDSLRKFYALHCLTRRRHGLPPQSWLFFEQIYQHIIAAGLGRVILAYHQDRPIAGAVFFRFGAQALYKFGASDFAHQHLRANDLIFWHATRYFSRQGCDTLDLGRTSLQQNGLRDFKLKWANREFLINYYKYAPSSGDWLETQVRQKGIHTYLFQRCPLLLLRAVGRLLYPHVG